MNVDENDLHQNLIRIKIMMNEIYRYNVSLKKYTNDEKNKLRQHCLKIYNGAKRDIFHGYNTNEIMGKLSQLKIFNIDINNTITFANVESARMKTCAKQMLLLANIEQAKN